MVETNLSHGFFSLIVCPTFSINSFIFGVCSLFLCAQLLSSLDSSASFTDSSFLTVITIGDTKYLSEYSSNFSKWPCCSSLLISLSTLSCNAIGTPRLFCLSMSSFQKSPPASYSFWFFLP